MKVDEVRQVVSALSNGWSGSKFTEIQNREFAEGLRDLPFEAALAAVRSLQRTEEFRPSIARVRLMVAHRLGLLPPGPSKAVEEAVVWVDAQAQLGFVNGGSYDPPDPVAPHPSVARVLDQLDVTHPSWTAQFRKIYERMYQSECRRVCAADRLGVTE